MTIALVVGATDLFHQLHTGGIEFVAVLLLLRLNNGGISYHQAIPHDDHRTIVELMHSIP
jgi:hypothetical protein